MSVAMSRGLTMPATLSWRISKFTRTSCVPLITRLPFGRTSVTTAATRRLMVSERSISPLLSVEVLDVHLGLERSAAFGQQMLLGFAAALTS